MHLVFMAALALVSAFQAHVGSAATLKIQPGFTNRLIGGPQIIMSASHDFVAMFEQDPDSCGQPTFLSTSLIAGYTFHPGRREASFQQAFREDFGGAVPHSWSDVFRNAAHPLDVYDLHGKLMCAFCEAKPVDAFGATIGTVDEGTTAGGIRLGHQRYIKFSNVGAVVFKLAC